MSLVQRTDCDQTKGVVGMLYFVDFVNKPGGYGKSSLFFRNGKQLFWSVERLRCVMPVRLSVAHLCYDDPLWNRLIPLTFAAISRSTLPRLCHHNGEFPFPFFQKHSSWV